MADTPIPTTGPARSSAPPMQDVSAPNTPPPTVRRAGTPTAEQWGAARDKLREAQVRARQKLAERGALGRQAAQRVEDLQRQGAAAQDIQEARAEQRMASQMSTAADRELIKINAKLQTAEYRSIPESQRAPIRPVPGAVLQPVSPEDVLKSGLPSSRGARRGQPRFGLVSMETPSEAVATFHEQSQRNFQKSATQRSRDLSKLGRRLAHTSYIIFFLVFAIAGLMDLLGLLKLAVEAVPVLGSVVGFVVNFITTPITLLCVTLPMIFAQYRIQKINKNTQAVQKYTVHLANQAAQLRTEMLPAIREMRRPYLAMITDPHGSGGVGEFVKYRSRILLNNLIVLALESVPYVDAGPWQTLKVWRVYVHQQKEFRHARIMFLGAQAINRRIELLERFYLEYLEFAFYRNLSREVGVREQIQPNRPISERLYATAQRIDGTKEQPQPFPNAPPPTMQDVALAT